MSKSKKVEHRVKREQFKKVGKWHDYPVFECVDCGERFIMEDAKRRHEAKHDADRAIKASAKTPVSVAKKDRYGNEIKE